MRRTSLFCTAAAALTFTACSEPDPPLRLTPYAFRLAGTDSVFHWPISSLPVRFYAEPVGRLPQYVRDGVLAWQRQLLYGEFRGTLVEDSAAADVIVMLEGSPPPDAPLTNDPIRTVCEGFTFLPSRVADASGTTRLAARIRIQVRSFPGVDSTDAQNCLAVVTMHELGHALGLLRHSDDPIDLMYDEPRVRSPSLRDQSTLQRLFHTATDIWPWDAAASAAPPGRAADVIH